ncbi:MAG TPA: hypothetical protein VGJ04_09070 [Pirellulales bacterium]
MKCSNRSKFTLLWLACALVLATSGCSLFQQTPPPQKPRTVGEFIAQPRVQP